MANFWCVDSEMFESSVIMKIPISGVLWYGQSHCDTYKVTPQNALILNLTHI